ncbi:hypothetical protein E4O75_09230 [Neisseria meningitidis]|nr:hypothetical protein [Neisseria meningitidis]
MFQPKKFFSRFNVVDNISILSYPPRNNLFVISNLGQLTKSKAVISNLGQLNQVQA